MQIDSAALYLLVKKLNKALKSSQIRQIHQIDNRIMDIEFFSSEGRPINLVLNTYNPPVIYIASQGKNKKQYSPSQTFCMTLRKYLEGARFSGMEQISMDRIICISFDRIEAGGEIVTRNLWVELLPASPNIILTENDIIIDACLRGKKADRLLIAGEKYKLPANSSRMDFMKFSENEILGILTYGNKAPIPLDEWLFSSFNGFSRYLVNELAFRSSILNTKPINELTNEETNKLAEEIIKLSNGLRDSQNCYLYREKGKQIISPIPLSFLKTNGKEIDILNWLAEASESGAGSIRAAVQEYTKHLRGLIKKEERKILKISEEMKETKLMEQYKLWGTLLSIYAYEKINHRDKLTVVNLFKDPPENEEIPVNPLLNVTANSQLYFKKYNKMKTRSAIGQKKLKECKNKLAYLNESLFFAEQIKSRQELNYFKDELKSSGIDKYIKPQRKPAHKNTVPLNIEERIIDGFHVFIGRSNIRNEYLSLHKAGKSDLWFHAKGIPGSHIVIETDNQSVPLSTIEKVAALAAFNSKGKDSGKVDVDYTFIKYVKKIPDGPPGLVNYTHQKTIVAIPTDIKK